MRLVFDYINTVNWPLFHQQTESLRKQSLGQEWQSNQADVRRSRNAYVEYIDRKWLVANKTEFTRIKTVGKVVFFKKFMAMVASDQGYRVEHAKWAADWAGAGWDGWVDGYGVAPSGPIRTRFRVGPRTNIEMMHNTIAERFDISDITGADFTLIWKGYSGIVTRITPASDTRPPRKLKHPGHRTVPPRKPQNIFEESENIENPYKREDQ